MPKVSRVSPLSFPKELQRGKELFSTSSPHSIIWANEGGGCVVPLPSVLYNGKTQASEPLRHRPVENHSYEFFGVDERGHHRTYHGTYRCIKLVTIDWEQLMSLDQEVSAGVRCSYEIHNLTR